MSHPLEHIQKMYDKLFGTKEDELKYPDSAIIPIDDAHFDSRPYCTYVDRRGIVHDLRSLSGPVRERLVDMGVYKPFEDLEQTMLRFVNDINDMDAQSLAEAFLIGVRDNHKYPDLTDASIAKALRVSAFTYSWDEQGYYKLTFVGFKDGSSWER